MYKKRSVRWLYITAWCLWLVCAPLWSDGLGAGGPLGEQKRDTAGKPPYVSMIDLIAHKAEYHGKQVFVKGYMQIEFENCALYLSREHAVHGLYKNALWVGFDEALLMTVDVRQYHNKHVMVLGTFNMHHQGHMGLWSGSMESITRIFPVISNQRWAGRRDQPWVGRAKPSILK